MQIMNTAAAPNMVPIEPKVVWGINMEYKRMPAISIAHLSIASRIPVN